MSDSTMPGEATLVASWQALARTSPGATVSETPASVAAVFPRWSALNNAIARVPATDADATAAEVVHLTQQYAAAGVDTWAYWVPSVSCDLDDADRARVAGATRDVTTLVMVAELSDALQPSPDAARTSIASAGVAGDEPVPVGELDAPDSGQALDAWAMVREGFAVAGVWACVHDGDCGIYAVGTAPDWRRRGLAGALVEHALADARSRGARTASLQSTPMAVSLYGSLGFVAVGRYEEWLVTARAAERGRGPECGDS
jgi:ribosomal protein S18 acetylase RimI-like enzyme